MDEVRSLVLAGALALTPSVPAAQAATSCAHGQNVEPTTSGLPDHDPSGNRVVVACRSMHGTWGDVRLPRPSAWVLAHPSAAGEAWIVVDADGSALEIRDGEAAPLLTDLAPGVAPQADWRDGRLVLSTRSRPAMTDDPVPHGRAVSLGPVAAALAEPTDRYDHAVLGDQLEASAIDIVSVSVSGAGALRVELAPNEVVEGISAIAAILADDGTSGLLVTVSDAQRGARLRAYDEQGAVIGESEPIGRGYRWLHQVGVGPVGPDGQVEVIVVRTPHIGGVLEAYRLSADRFERVASITGYSSHVIGSANLDMALLADTDEDGLLEVVVPTQSMTELAVLERTADGFAELSRLPLDGVLASNVAAAVDTDGRLSLAVATSDGRLRVFR